MRLFKSLLLTLLVVGTLNSCKKDAGGGSGDGSSKSKDSVVNSGYSTASINCNYHEYSYTLKRTNDNIEEFELVPDISWRISGDFHLNNDGKPFKTILFEDDVDTVQIKYVGSDISEITSSHDGTREEFESNFKLIESKKNQYVYGVEYNDPNGLYQIDEGLKINVYPDLDSVHIIRFDSLENEPSNYEEFGFKYVKSVKTSFAINCFNYSQAELKGEIWNCAEPLIVANILENLGATYFNGGSDKDYEISFDQNKLPVKILNKGYRLWTAIYQ